MLQVRGHVDVSFETPRAPADGAISSSSSLLNVRNEALNAKLELEWSR